MAATMIPPDATQTNLPPKLSRWVMATLVLACVVVVAAVAALSLWWPFSPAHVLENLREAGDSQVELRGFHTTYFPSPGCILDGVVFHHSRSEAKPLITIEKLTIRGSYLGLLAQRVSQIKAEGMLISLPPLASAAPFHTSRSSISYDEIVADGTIIEFDSSDPKTPALRFEVQQALLRDVSWKSPLTYQVKVHNPQPPGIVTAQGKFGVWQQGSAGETPISGEYKFDQADLSVYDGIGGTLSSTGKFSGKLAHIDISGQTDTPDFTVTMGNHPVRLTTQFKAYVDATKGDTFLNQVDAEFAKTHLSARGSIATSANGKGKTAIIDVHSQQARIQDLLHLFVKDNRTPMSGDVKLQAHVQIPPGDDFLKKIKLRGNFGIARGEFSDSMQESVDKFSAGARGESEKEQADPETVLTGLSGQVDVFAGSARFSDLSFEVPGAKANLQGTYNLIDHKIDLRGQLEVATKISDTTSGGKALILKMMEPFFKKQRKGEIVPVKIAGTYEKPTFGLDLKDKKAQTSPMP
jgi:hypothetical protein